MKPYAFSLAMAAGILLTGCETRQRTYPSSGASVSPGVGTVSGYYVSPAIDTETRARLESQAPQTYARIYTTQPLSLADIAAMERAGVGDDIIIGQIGASRSVYRLTAADIVDLHNSNVSDRVIDAMIKTAEGVYTTVPASTVYVREGPPTAPPESAVVSPNPEYVWVPGEYTWTNDRWIWIPGRWAPRPFTGAEWVKGSWVKTPDGWKHDPGHWR
jgi:YXWGXW repeat-containing protein